MCVGTRDVMFPPPPPKFIFLCANKTQMSTRTFEGVLHPVFQEEETTLIIAGAILGAIAGFLQMLLSTKGVRDAAKKAASLAAEKASAAVSPLALADANVLIGLKKHNARNVSRLS